MSWKAINNCICSGSDFHVGIWHCAQWLSGSYDSMLLAFIIQVFLYFSIYDWSLSGHLKLQVPESYLWLDSRILTAAHPHSHMTTFWCLATSWSLWSVAVFRGHVTTFTTSFAGSWTVGSELLDSSKQLVSGKKTLSCKSRTAYSQSIREGL